MKKKQGKTKGDVDFHDNDGITLGEIFFDYKEIEFLESCLKLKESDVFFEKFHKKFGFDHKPEELRKMWYQRKILVRKYRSYQKDIAEQKQNEELHKIPDAPKKLVAPIKVDIQRDSIPDEGILLVKINNKLAEITELLKELLSALHENTKIQREELTIQKKDSAIVEKNSAIIDTEHEAWLKRNKPL
jgi:hypothetical protein